MNKAWADTFIGDSEAHVGGASRALLSPLSAGQILAIKAELLSKIGEPYGEPHRCMSFLCRALALCGIVISEGTLREAKEFVKVETAQFADVAIFQELPFREYHAAFMIERRWAIQTSRATNGVARIEISRSPWRDSLRGIYRHRSLCS